MASMKVNLTDSEIILINGGVYCFCTCKGHVDALSIVLKIGMKISSDACREDCCVERHFFKSECEDATVELNSATFIRSGSSLGSGLITAPASTKVLF